MKEKHSPSFITITVVPMSKTLYPQLVQWCEFMELCEFEQGVTDKALPPVKPSCRKLKVNDNEVLLA